ncbi:16S rRNA (cytidine(1402)-2'-O)-methyltransferase [Corynebacterium sp. 13CS0277]|uniref:16S rRNA (cytidine(1402)-2'-O)-methyltransferase n=1 Tax=Corynebacterium sp. 13CS0277 TaxID=2071994 RepID=UPI0018EB8FAC|nr:16S rRNA (cytidine(1402)-2'-O)-methyltransferase [Corynebacterium sp. 13CS0277]
MEAPLDVFAAQLREPLPQGVILAATPLGNPGDATFRLVNALARADVIAAEDTRRTRALAAALGVTPTGSIVSNFDHNEADRVEQLLEAARHGSVLVVTDAGMPVVSDPGLNIVAAAHAAGVPVTCLPGPSAVPTALALSGLGVGHFAFDGFAPRKQGAKRTWLEEVARSRRAVAFFESPHRIEATLEEMEEVLGDTRRVAVCRELTKTYEEVFVGTLPEVRAWAQGGVRGEITVVVDAADDTPPESADLVSVVLARVEAGERLKDAAKAVAKEYGAKPKALYDAVLAARDM